MYSPALGRFIQPDTIVPDMFNPQSLNRYSYVLNNPIRYTDPTGHCPGVKPGVKCASNPQITTSSVKGSDTDNDGIPNIPDPDFGPITNGRFEQADCIPGNLVECFYGGGHMPDGDYEVTLEEFLFLLKAISYDAPQQGTMSDYNYRAWYDTPFYDGGYVNANICIATVGCFMGHEINYIAQGVASASVREGVLTNIALTTMWKMHEYGEIPSLNTIYAATIGHNYYTAVHNDYPLYETVLLGNTVPFFNTVSTLCPTVMACLQRDK